MLGHNIMSLFYSQMRWGFVWKETKMKQIQGGPAKVRPTYIFAGNIILLTFECIGKIQWFLANVITV